MSVWYVSKIECMLIEKVVTISLPQVTPGVKKGFAFFNTNTCWRQRITNFMHQSQ